MPLSIRGLPIFVLDSRSERSHRRACPDQPAMLCGPRQWQALLDWLQDQPRHLPKLVVCPALMLPRRRDSVPAIRFDGAESHDLATLRADAWCGYPNSLLALLQHLAAHGIERVLLLSGDEHLGLYTHLTLQAPGKVPVQVHSLHSPGLYAPFSFANGAPEEFLLDETFAFGEGLLRDHTCQVRTTVHAGHGFLEVRLEPEAGGAWRLQVTSPQGLFVEALL
jgi:hypothetical protein